MDGLEPGGQSGGRNGTVVQTLGRRIATEEYAAGHQLRVEDLSAEFGVSRTVIRESLRALEAKQMVAARPRVGTTVVPLGRINLLDPDVILWRMSGPAANALLLELVDLRRAIEPLAARRLAELRDGAGLRELRQAAERMSEALAAEDVRAFTEADIQFHRLIVTRSGNHLFSQLVDTVSAALRAREQLHLIPEHPGPLADAVDAHVAVVDLLEAGEVDLVEAAMRQIIDEVVGQVTRTLPQGGQP